MYTTVIGSYFGDLPFVINQDDLIEVQVNKRNHRRIQHSKG